MNKCRFLLTYVNDNGEDTYAWFATESELVEFVEYERTQNNRFDIYDAQEIISAREISV